MDAEQEGCGDSSFVSVEMSPLASFADLSWLAHLKLRMTKICPSCAEVYYEGQVSLLVLKNLENIKDISIFFLIELLAKSDWKPNQPN